MTNDYRCGRGKQLSAKTAGHGPCEGGEKRLIDAPKNATAFLLSTAKNFLTPKYPEGQRDGRRREHSAKIHLIKQMRERSILVRIALVLRWGRERVRRRALMDLGMPHGIGSVTGFWGRSRSKSVYCQMGTLRSTATKTKAEDESLVYFGICQWPAVGWIENSWARRGLAWMIASKFSATVYPA